MTIKEFVDKALDGGYVENPRWKFVGANQYWVWWEEDFGEGDDVSIPIEKYVLAPEVWQAVGKVSGWCDGSCQQGNIPLGELEDGEIEWGGCLHCVDYQRDPKYIDNTWLAKMHAMIDALCNGQSIEDYLNTL